MSIEKKYKDVIDTELERRKNRGTSKVIIRFGKPFVILSTDYSYRGSTHNLCYVANAIRDGMGYLSNVNNVLTRYKACKGYSNSIRDGIRQIRKLTQKEVDEIYSYEKNLQ